MNRSPRFVLPCFCFILTVWLCLTGYLANFAFASHNLAGQITYKMVGNNKYEILLTTYTDSAAKGVDRCVADIEVWGVQGATKIYITTLKEIPRMNGPISGNNCDGNIKNGEQLRPHVKRNRYLVTYTFNGPGVFELRYKDIARVNNVKNMANSDATTFYVETRLINNPFVGENNSVLLLNEPVDDACTNRLWTHNPGGYDPDGDSLVYSLINCQQYDPPNFSVPVSVANYQYPNAFGGSFTIDRETGLVTWDTPKQIGIYNISIKVEEYRNGRLLSYVIRDMAIFVEPCKNDPPIIEVEKEEYCVRAGETVLFRIHVYDPNQDPPTPDSFYVYLNNSGLLNNGPFSVDNSPATLTRDGNGQQVLPNPDPPYYIDRFKEPNDAKYIFKWQTNCSHIKRGFYQLDLYAHDNFHAIGRPSQKHPTLAANKIVKIYVTPAPVKNLNAEAGSRKATLTWNPNVCDDAIGYDVYRSDNGGTIDTSSCCKEPGSPSGFVKIARVNGWNNTTYVDDNNGEGLEFRGSYCYTIVTVFPDRMLSCPSDTACIKIKRDMPIIVNDSVTKTDASAGEILVRWQSPDYSKIDQSFYPRPYTYKLSRSRGFGTGQFVEFNQIFTESDTVFTDTNLDTENNAYSYRVRMFDANGEYIEQSDKASSVYLSTIPGNKKIRVVWEEHTPWINKSYEVYRADEFGGPFNLIATVPNSGGNKNFYDDKGADLPNGLEFKEDYCYFVRSIGSYDTPGVKDPLKNDSEIKCEVPLDSVPPCLPDSSLITAESDCETLTLTMKWQYADPLCSDDVKFYRIYFSEDTVNFTKPILVYQTPDSSTHEHTQVVPSLSGCFALTAVDDSGNESVFSSKFCFDNCPVINIPNFWRPNGGVPLQAVFFRSVREFTFRVYDRWGVEVAYSNDEKNLWNGKYRNGDKNVVPGHYFYVLEGTLDNQARTKFSRTGGITIVN